MSRPSRTLPLVALLALPLVSCLHERGDCPTCPPANSARLLVRVPARVTPPIQLGMDSVVVTVDGTQRVSVRQGRTGAIEGLSRGTHDVVVVRWFSIDGIPSSSTTQMQIVLLRAETRLILFHNDFPLVVWSPLPTLARPGPLEASAPPRVG